ncbi:MAG: protein kinase [Gemmataceae bacterium]|nr:protein kinase [Gemmataceae bacterium]
MTPPAAHHPTDETLVAYGLGKIGDAEADAVMRHLEGCPECKARVAEMSADSFVGRLRAAAGPDGTAPPEKSLSGLSRATRGGFGRKPTVVPPELMASGQYIDIRELGHGGMGVVYLATNRLLNRPEVLKVVNRTLLDKPGAAERFLREMQSAARLQHRNVVAAYSAHQFGDLLVFAMEYVEGDDLAKVVKARGPVLVPNGCFYAYHTALGLQHAHERGMVHRDIKPSNLILTREDGKSVVKILDFGLAKATSEKGVDGDLTGEGKMMGTPDYMAPEQALNARGADIRADIYSLGCTLYFLLAGKPPFEGSSLLDLLQKHQSTDARGLNFVRPEVPTELAAVAAKMMAKEPDRRYQTPGEVAKELARFVKPAGGSGVKPVADVSRGAGGTVAPAGTAPNTPVVPKSVPPENAPQADAPAEWKPPSVFRDGPVPVHTQHVNAEDINPPARAADRKPRQRAKAAPARKRPRWAIPVGVAGAVLLVVLVAVAGGVFKAKTKDGTIVVENVPADATVEVDGETVTLTRNGETVTVSAVQDGERKVKVVRSGVEVWSKDVTVKLGGEPIRVRLEPPAGPPIPPAAGAKPLPVVPKAVVSRFAEGDDEGWTTRNMPRPGGIPPDPTDPIEVRSVGKDFHLFARDRSPGEIWGWVAPPKFCGNQSDKFGGLLKYRIFVGEVDPGRVTTDVVYVGVKGSRMGMLARGTTIGRINPGSVNQYAIRLDGSGAWLRGERRATDDEVREVLSDVEDLWIRGEYPGGVPGRSGDCRLDDVELLPPGEIGGKTTPKTEQPPAKTDSLTPGSVFKGTRTYTKGAFAGGTVPYELHVVGRDGKKFSGHVFDNGPGRNRATVEGEFDGDTITWREQSAFAANQVYMVTGKLDGDTIRVTERSERGGRWMGDATATLTRVEPAATAKEKKAGVPNTDLLRTGTSWTGPKTGGRPGHSFTLDVTSRDGTDFKGVVTTDGGLKKVEVEGSVSGSDIEWRSGKVLGPDGSLRPFRGTISDDRIDAKAVGADVSVTLKLSKK